MLQRCLPLALSGFMHLAAGLSVGLTGLAAGYAIGVVGDAVSKILLQLSACLEAKGVIGGSVIHVTVKNIRGHGTNIDFWRGVGSLWVRFKRWGSTKEHSTN